MRGAYLVVLALSACDRVDLSCRLGSARACGALGDRLLREAGGRPAPRVCELYRTSCAGAITTACVNLGALVAQRLCAAARPGEARGVLAQACDLGDPGACNNLGMVTRDGDDTAPGDPTRAAAFFRKACSAGAATACDNLGALLIETDEAGAAAAFDAGCATATADRARDVCCYKVGLAFANGWGRKPDPRRAAELYAQACAKSIAGGCYEVGRAELKRSELAAAAEHFQQACDGGEAGACNDLGLMYSEAFGVPRDEARAVSLLQKACDKGDLRACANVGSRYVLGNGTARDEARGYELIQRACNGGIAEACRQPARASLPAP